MRFRIETDGVLFDRLKELFPDSSNATIRKMLRQERVEIDGRVIRRADTPVRAGQEIAIVSARAPGTALPGRILFRDEALLAVEKPAGILSVSRDRDGGDTFYRRVFSYVHSASRGRSRIFIVHRLDKEVSGIMLFALDPLAQERLQRNWSGTEKRYWALVEGGPPEETGTVRSWLRENRIHRVFSGPESPDARLAVTQYRVRRSGSSQSLLEVRIETGRKNQIRAHLSELGCPVVGDRKYGARTDPIGRLGLHAFFLAFTHPFTGEWIRLRSRIPGVFRVA